MSKKSYYKYPPLPPEPVDNMMDWAVPFPLELYDSGILKIPITELNQCTYVLTKNICGLHFIGSRVSIQTTIPCQGQLSNITFICPSRSKQKIADFILRIIQYHKDLD